ncbi:hypothetical protein WHR41_06097 [Cladosporium halotolerans]|uniref:Non-homologous end-joining factor 1 n=1 Tax=Cladosporium halotolerans TaxID=1052096 RepID=A0AB34KNG7_9PEZI
MGSWSKLHHSSDDLPSLLVKSSFSRDGYSVYLTDLSRIWIETLGREEIVARAKRLSCSIDPEEDDQQFQIFLDKIVEALEQKQGTSLSLSPSRNSELKLSLTAPLPASLPTFDWELILKRAADESIGHDLIFPLLHRAHQLNRNLEALIAELQAKDKIIAKITDRLETSGHDLTAVFPGVANVRLSRKKSQQEQLARHVRGLGRFDEAAFKAQVAQSEDGDGLSSESLNAIFASLPAPSKDTKNQHFSADWWREIPPGQYVDLNPAEDVEMTGNGQAGPEGLEDHEGDITMEDDFQRQATPPRLRNERPPEKTDNYVSEDDDAPKPPSMRNESQQKTNNKPPSPSPQPESLVNHEADNDDDDDSTEDEDDLDGPAQPSKPQRKPSTPPPHDPSPKDSPPKPPVNKPSPPRASRGPFTHEDATDSDSDDLDAPSQPSQNPSSSSHLPTRHKSPTPKPAPTPKQKLHTLGGVRSHTTSPAPPAAEPPTSSSPTEPAPAQNPSKPKPNPKPKLGTIGGRKPTPQPQPQPSPEPPSSPPLPSPSKPKPKAKSKQLGTIGGKRAASSSSRAASKEPTPPPPPPARKPRMEKKVPPDSRPEIGSKAAEERADAKRKALERELEAKARAGGRKRRRF